MKIGKLIISQALSVTVVLSAFAQGTFENLNFEQANPVSSGDGYPFFYVTAASALPYWTVTIGGVQQTQIPENTASLGSPDVILEGPGSPIPPIDGNYSVLLQGSDAVASISQTGLIPGGTQSLLFEAEKGFGGAGNGNLSVLIGTQTLSITPLATQPTYTLYGANISAWAGQSEELTFSALEGGLNNWTIDDISFSPGAVPEPNPLALTAIGGLLFAVYRPFAPKRQSA
jgi:hypothetical protein